MAALQPAAAAVTGALLAMFDGAWRKLCPGSGGPQMPLGDQPASGSIWDDPALWMLMMH